MTHLLSEWCAASLAYIELWYIVALAAKLYILNIADFIHFYCFLFPMKQYFLPQSSQLKPWLFCKKWKSKRSGSYNVKVTSYFLPRELLVNLLLENKKNSNKLLQFQGLFTWRWGTPGRWGKVWRVTPPIM